MDGELLQDFEWLVGALEEEEVEFVLVGGLGLYLRDAYYDEDGRSRRYPARPESRTTEDIDLFLTESVLIENPKTIREVIDGLGYVPREEFFQFVKNPDPDKIGPKIDLMSAAETDDDSIRVGEIRVKPPESGTGLHARKTPEAVALDRNKIEIPFRDIEVIPAVRGSVFIPSSVNFVVLKLHAFRDREESDDEEDVEVAEHNGFDIFRIVTDMRIEDWNDARDQVRDDRGLDYLREAARVQESYFGDVDSVGVRRLRRSENFLPDPFAEYIEDFVKDLTDLFGDVEPLRGDEWSE